MLSAIPVRGRAGKCLQRRLHRYLPRQFLLSSMLVNECVRAVACCGYRCMREDAFRVLRRADGPVPFFHACTVCSFHALGIFRVLRCPWLSADGPSALHLLRREDLRALCSELLRPRAAVSSLRYRPSSPFPIINTRESPKRPGRFPADPASVSTPAGEPIPLAARLPGSRRPSQLSH